MKRPETNLKRTRPKLRALAATGWICLCLLMFSGCSGAKIVRQVDTVKLTPPALLMRETATPALHGNTNRDLLNFVLELRAALREANADKAALREWASEAKENANMGKTN